jgi:hypothetical protein
VRRGSCYYTSEALYHLLGGKKAGWKPMYMNTRPTGRHWFLQHESGLILDATKAQFPKSVKVDYTKARGCGFMTKSPSNYAKKLMDVFVWYDDKRFK